MKISIIIIDLFLMSILTCAGGFPGFALWVVLSFAAYHLNIFHNRQTISQFDDLVMKSGYNQNDFAAAIFVFQATHKRDFVNQNLNDLQEVFNIFERFKNYNLKQDELDVFTVYTIMTNEKTMPMWMHHSYDYQSNKNQTKLIG